MRVLSAYTNDVIYCGVWTGDNKHTEVKTSYQIVVIDDAEEYRVEPGSG